MKKEFRLNDELYEISDLKRDSTSVSFMLSGKRYLFSLDSQGQMIESEEGNEVSRVVRLISAPDEFLIHGRRLVFSSVRKMKASGGALGTLTSPMPGKILKVFVATGASVKKGDPLLVLEAMKMEHTIKAPFDGVVHSTPFKEGDQVQAKVELMGLKEVQDADS
jgi:3-methylcrotonyl-CoA carboxylase alpha subunit